MLVTFLCLVGCALGADTADPTAIVLRSPHPVWAAAAESLDGGPAKAVFLLTRDSSAKPPAKSLRVHHPEPGGYAPKAATVLALEPEASVLFFAEYNGEAPRELVAAHAGGAQVYTWRAGEWLLLAEPVFSSLLPSGAKEPVFLDMAEDLDGDGRDEWMLPVFDGYEIRRGDELLARAPCDVVSEFRRDTAAFIVHRLPMTDTFDAPDGGPRGLAFLSDSYADFAYGAQWEQRRRFEIPV